MRRNVREFLEYISPYLEVATVLEIGSLQVETQENLSNLRPLFPRSLFLGSDIRKGKGVDIVQDAHDLAIKSSSVDLVLCIDTLEHILDPWTAIKEFKRVLSDNGTLIISSVMDFPIHDYPNDYWRFTPEIFWEFLKDLKYKKIFFQGDFFKPDTLIAIGSKKELELEFPKKVANRDLFEYSKTCASTAETKPTNWLPPAIPDEHSSDFLSKLAEEVAKMIPLGAKILDVGCFLGLCTDIILKKRCIIQGIALDKYTYGLLSNRYSRVFTLDEFNRLTDRFDVVLMMDLHIRELFPISRTRKILKEDGFLILSIPNIFHISFILEILKDTPDILSKLALGIEELPVLVEDMIKVEARFDEVWYSELWAQLPEDFRNIVSKAADINTYRILLKCKPYEKSSYKENKKDFLRSFLKIIQELKALAHQKYIFEKKYREIINSKSWKVTEPFRKAKKLLKDLI